jgi:adenylate kinase
MKIILLGPPGSGKGTQGAKLSKSLQIPEISTGDMLRQAVAEKSTLGQQVGDIINQGRLVPDDLIISVIEERISRMDCDNGFILDGFPRTIEQGEALERVLPESVDVVIYFNVSSEAVVDRLAGRLTCRKCGTVYPNMDTSLCSACGGDLYQREDDMKSTVLRRLRLYEEHTKPLVAFYRGKGKIAEIDGQGSVEEIAQRVEEGIAQVLA